MNAAIVGWSAPTVSDGKSFVSLTISALSTLSSLSLATLAAVLQAPGPTFHWLLLSHKERIWDDPLRTQQLASVSPDAQRLISRPVKASVGHFCCCWGGTAGVREGTQFRGGCSSASCGYRNSSRLLSLSMNTHAAQSPQEAAGKRPYLSVATGHLVKCLEAAVQCFFVRRTNVHRTKCA